MPGVYWLRELSAVIGVIRPTSHYGFVPILTVVLGGAISFSLLGRAVSS